MPLYEFRCPKGHVLERLVPIGTEMVQCDPCLTEEKPPMCMMRHMAKRIMSPTRTNFVHAGGRKP